MTSPIVISADVVLATARRCDELARELFMSLPVELPEDDPRREAYRAIQRAAGNLEKARKALEAVRCG